MSSLSRNPRSTCARALAAYFEGRIALGAAAGLPPEWATEGEDGGAAGAVRLQVSEGAVDHDDDDALILPAKFDEMAFPALILSAPTAREHEMGGGFMVVQAQIIIATQIDEEGAPRRHAARVGWVCAQLFDRVDEDDANRESLDIVAAELSAPATGEDVRAVKDFRCYGFGDLDEQGVETARHVVDELRVDVFCQAHD